MKLRSKIIACMAGVFVLFGGATGVALVGMNDAGKGFENFIRSDMALLQAVTGMYADGLQGGQALRNVVLDPGNKTGHKNLDKAVSDFKDKQAKALALAAASPADVKVLQEIAVLRDKQLAVLAKVAALSLDNPAAAITLVSQEETPAWRAVRGRLLELIEAKNSSAEQTKSQVLGRSQTMATAALAFVLVALVLGAAIVFWLVRHIMGQLGGEPAYAAQVARAISAGDLSQEVVVSSRADSDSLMVQLRSMQDSLVRCVSEVRFNSEGVASSSEQIAQGNADLSGRTEQQASALQETAASMEELDTTVKQNADNAKQANALAISASGVAVQGGQVVAQVVDTMKGINDSSRKIADIISVIDGIAFQTNILALNAAVEAARAGEQGRGFAVVASEVRSLASRSADAARQIKDLIGASVARVEQGSALADQAGATMGEVVAAIRRVTDIMGEISHASSEQSAGVSQVGDAVGQMDKATQQNAALVEQSAAAADGLKTQARQLVAAVAVFKLAGAASAQPAF
ncbi:methyl-accepting chemotaxis protein [uncultured Ramlibacter sp.]|uniref:methyl-accepting chemotaxis protein n=1 Tax=uncultured Ramlibacter sp. TaxID=260755 RepID=UPI00261E0F8C|nr:methyl-accepting chemotaxis protein [uncultured Ramlibacter sp.]